MKQYRGILLLEILIAIGIISIFLPLFCESFFHIVRCTQTLHSTVTRYFYKNYLYDVLFQDLSSAKQFVQLSSDNIRFLDASHIQVTYSLSSGRFGRKEGSSPTVYLYNSIPEVQTFFIETQTPFTLKIIFTDHTSMRIIPMFQPTTP